MKKPRLVLSDAAVADILEQADWYSAQSGEVLARRWEKAFTAAGAPCAFRSPELQGVRRTTISGFPKHLLFYRFDEGVVVVLRVVHGARDLERLLIGGRHVL